MSTTSPAFREQIHGVRKRISDTRDEMARVAKLRDQAKAAYAHSTSELPPQQDPNFQAAANFNAESLRLQEQLNLLKEEETFYLSRITGQDTNAFERSFMEDPAVLTELSSLATSSSKIGNLNLGRVTSRERLVEQLSRGRSMAADEVLDYAPTGVARVAPFRGVVPQLRRQFTLLDLIPTEVMENNVIPFVRETGTLDTAYETEELAIKPAGDLTLEDVEAVARTIPVWFKLSRQTLNDIAGLATALNNRLLYAVRSRFEYQILGGDGQGENLTGILNTSGIATVNYTDWSTNASLIPADAALEGIVDVILSDAQPSGVVLHPNDWMAMQRAKAAGSGVYLSGGPFGQTPRELWGLPVVLNRIMPQGQALIGDFNIGVTALVREAPNVRLSDSDSDDFIRNRVTVLAEGRFGVAVWQPAAFAVVQLTDPS